MLVGCIADGFTDAPVAHFMPRVLPPGVTTPS